RAEEVLEEDHDRPHVRHALAAPAQHLGQQRQRRGLVAEMLVDVERDRDRLEFRGRVDEDAEALGGLEHLEVGLHHRWKNLSKSSRVSLIPVGRPWAQVAEKSICAASWRSRAISSSASFRPNLTAARQAMNSRARSISGTSGAASRASSRKSIRSVTGSCSATR